MSYQKLPSYFYVGEEKSKNNYHFETDENERFKYYFMALGVPIRGFKATCHLVLCVDGSFLKYKCGGHMSVAITLDVNNHLYPVAFVVVDGENNNVWMYFTLKLRDTIEDVANLVFVSNGHKSIPNALSTIFPEARHGACTYHVKISINHKFETDHCDVEYKFNKLAANAYQISDFNHQFEKIKVKDPAIDQYFEEISVEK